VKWCFVDLVVCYGKIRQRSAIKMIVCLQIVTKFRHITSGSSRMLDILNRSSVRTPSVLQDCRTIRTTVTSYAGLYTFSVSVEIVIICRADVIISQDIY
jgi:hypothetical protein